MSFELEKGILNERLAEAVSRAMIALMREIENLQRSSIGEIHQRQTPISSRSTMSSWSSIARAVGKLSVAMQSPAPQNTAGLKHAVS